MAGKKAVASPGPTATAPKPAPTHACTQFGRALIVKQDSKTVTVKYADGQEKVWLRTEVEL